MTPFASGVTSGLVVEPLTQIFASAPAIIYGNDVISIQYTTIPEPTTALLLAAGVLITFVFRRRRSE